MRSTEEIQHVLELCARGLSNREISVRTGVPSTTIWRWRTKRAGHRPRARATCPICEDSPETLPSSAYAYLLGLYLGDGCITAGPRRVYRLRVTLDLRYPAIIDACAAAIQTVVPTNKLIRQTRHVRPDGTGGCADLSMYWKHWPCLFPQHGAGPKHLRPIKLDGWQASIAEAHPERLLEGLIHSDGTRGMNIVKGRERTYSYPRYQFSNLSADIRRMFCAACEQLGIHWTTANHRNISVARGADVARLDTFIGPKH